MRRRLLLQAQTDWRDRGLGSLQIPWCCHWLLNQALPKGVLSGASVATQISEPLLRVDAAAKTPVTPSVLGFSRSALTRLRLLPANAMQLSLELLCSVPTQLNAALQEKWVNGEGLLSVLSRRMGLDPLFRAPLTP